MRALPLHDGARGLYDDAAVLQIGQETLILTHDAMAQGVHFRDDADMADVAWKLVTSNLSDLAAKGAEPIGVLLGYSLGNGDERFLQGLHDVTALYGAPLLGGDTIGAGQSRSFGLTAIGRATYSPVPTRSGAAIGDILWVTGTLGRAMMGFEGADEHLTAFNRPIPRLTEGRALAPIATAMMDISDGLLLDAFRMADASRVTLAIDSSTVPVADADRAEDCMRWGDDYELLFTLPRDIQPPITATPIGRAEPLGFAPLLLDGEAIANGAGLGFQHSASNS